MYRSAIILNLPYIMRKIKSRKMIWAGHAARVGENRNASVSWRENLKKRDRLKDLGVDGKIILKWS